MKFLTAEWKHLLFANYRVQPDVLAPWIPDRTRLDSFDGHAFVSLVAFLFERTRVLGIPIPLYGLFEEVNLRFYVSPIDDPSKRAVTFIREIVPKRAIPIIANSLFHENYVALPMSHATRDQDHAYSWTNEAENTFSGRVTEPLAYPAAGSIAEFITEHYWGYSRGKNRTLEYRVEHPQWRCGDVEEFDVDVDFAATYGPEFGFLSNQAPATVLYAEGSEVSVSFPRRL